MIVETKDLNVAYESYKKGDLMRKDMIRVICDSVIALQGDVTQLRKDAAEVVAARAELAAIREQLAGLDTRIEAKVATAVNATVSMVQAMNGYGPAGDAPAKQRGRPRAEAREVA